MCLERTPLPFVATHRSAAEAEPTPVVQAPAAHVEALSEFPGIVGMGDPEMRGKKLEKGSERVVRD